MTLWEGLHASYSSRSAEAPAQLALLFSLLEPSQQPVEAMKGSIAKLGLPFSQLHSSCGITGAK